jgi:hypothetical protein
MGKFFQVLALPLQTRRYSVKAVEHPSTHHPPSYCMPTMKPFRLSHAEAVVLCYRTFACQSVSLAYSPHSLRVIESRFFDDENGRILYSQ